MPHPIEPDTPTPLPGRQDWRQDKPDDKHGLSVRAGHITWRRMISRCDQPTYPGWRWYGGRGIQVCPRWRDRETGLINFLADMGPRPEGTSIERRDNSGNYEPGNCYWAVLGEQARNR